MAYRNAIGRPLDAEELEQLHRKPDIWIGIYGPKADPSSRRKAQGRLVRRLGERMNLASPYVSSLRPRYYGGLPNQRYQLDVEWTFNEDNQLVIFGGSTGLAWIRGWQVLAVSPFARTDAIGNRWFGVGFGNAWTFWEPTAPGGGLLLTYASGGGIQQLELGNRTGFLASRGIPEWWSGCSSGLGYWAVSYVESRVLSIGAREHAAEVGLSGLLDVVTEPDGAEVQGSSVRDSLRDLDELRDDGLVTAEEYAAKRAEILGRL